MFEEEVILQNETGLHARPASLLVKEASKFKSDIKIIVKEKEKRDKATTGATKNTREWLLFAIAAAGWVLSLIQFFR